MPLWSRQALGPDRPRPCDLIGETGSRVVYVPLICQTNFGNEQSMVRWIKKGRRGTYDYDFSVMDKYLDLAEKNMGKPKIVVFNVWDVYLTPGADYDNDAWWNKLTEEQRKSDVFLVLESAAISSARPRPSTAARRKSRSSIRRARPSSRGIPTPMTIRAARRCGSRCCRAAQAHGQARP